MMLQTQVDLSPFNTLSLPGRAALYRRITAPAQLAARSSALAAASSLVAAATWYSPATSTDCCCTWPSPASGCSARMARHFYIEAGAGENWHDFVQWTLAQGWPGLENLSLIPGTVGAAPIQNIGAYGLEVGECLHSVTAWDFAKQAVVSFDRDDCRPYRDSRSSRRAGT